MAAAMKKLVTDRKIEKTRLTKLKTFMEKTDNVTQHGLQSKYDQYLNVKKSYYEIQSEIIQIADDDATQENEITELTNMDEKVNELDVMFAGKFVEFNIYLYGKPQDVRDNNDSMDDLRSIHDLHIKKRNIRLPNLDLPKFNGQYDKWLDFKEQFKAVIVEDTTIDSRHKLLYLRSCLQGSAEHIEADEDTFDSLWAALTHEFENRRLILDKHISELLSEKSMTNKSSNDLRRIVNNTKKHVRTFKALEFEMNELTEAFINHVVLQKIDGAIRNEFEMKLEPDDLVTWTDLMTFLQKKCNTLESLEKRDGFMGKKKTDGVQNKQASKTKIINVEIDNNNENCEGGTTSSNFNRNDSSNFKYSKNLACYLCKGKHYMTECPEFLKLDVKGRWEKVEGLDLCSSCLKRGHKVDSCDKSHCNMCSEKHHSLLHVPKSCETSCSSSDIEFSGHFLHGKQVLLHTTLVNIFDRDGNAHQCRCLLDSGSQSNIMSENLFQLLKLKGTNVNINVLGVNEGSTRVNHRVLASVGSRINDFKMDFEFLVMKKPTADLPVKPFDINVLKLPPNIELADETLCSPGKIDLLIGKGEHKDIFKNKVIHLGRNLPVAELTEFGYVIGGRLNVTNIDSGEVVCNVVTNDDLNELMKKFWELESVAKKSVFSHEENLIEEEFMKNHYRYPDGRYGVKLLVNNNAKRLGNSKRNALKRFRKLESRLNENSELRIEYVKFMNEYLTMNHMELIQEDAVSFYCDGYYLPHHAVVRPSSSSTKLRVVFDGSAKSSSGVALNEILNVGPVVQSDFRDILLRFRMLKYVFTCDIVKMYRQVRIHPDDRKFQKVLWRESPTEPIQVFQLCTVTYGTSNAPYLATRSLVQLARDEMENFPRASVVLERDVYVDDCLSGANCLNDAIELRNELMGLLALGKLEVHKWCANDEQLLEGISNEFREPLKLMNQELGVKTLGITWLPTRDQFAFNVNVDSFEFSEDGKITKRMVASQIHKYFDPLGLTGPVGLCPKLFMQSLFVKGYDWDDDLNDSDKEYFLNYIERLKGMDDILVDRFVLSFEEPENIQIHGFSDASNVGYGACIYVRCVDKCGVVKTSLLVSRSRVAPLKAQTIARLELCAAELLVELWDSIASSLPFNVNKKIWWSDSFIVLSWIKMMSRQLNVFVSHRVSKIQELSCPADWRYVSSCNNSADVLSRGLMPDQLKDCKIWWNGPQFLELNESDWPVDKFIFPKEELPDVRSQVYSVKMVDRSMFFNLFSSYIKLIRVTALCLRFVNNIRSKKVGKEGKSGFVDGKDLFDAKLKLIELVQEEQFSNEIACLLKKKDIDKNSRLVRLAPFIDSSGLLRVGGRLENSLYSYNQKHPFILPSNHPFTDLLIRHYHEDNLHVGVQILLAMIRCKYWVLKGRSQVKKIVIRCVKCFRVKPKLSEQLMGQLPEVRVQPSAPFLHSGVDYAGPFSVKVSRNVSQKTYLALFTCMFTRSLHLELAGDMSAECFLNVLHRFIARRGLPKSIYSDNGTNFVGAQNRMNDLKKLFENEKQFKKISDYCDVKGIEWKFIPPRSPHMGGSWESMVRLVKQLLVKCLGKELLTYEELNTVFHKIEAILNSRPLIHMSDDNEDLSALTPGHFIIGRPLTELAEPDLVDLRVNRLTRYQLLCRLKQDFWHKWSHCYLKQLQDRYKWHSVINVRVGQVVVLQEEGVPATQWLLGRIIELHPGKDNVTRVVTIKTKNGNFKRALAKLSYLPIDDNMN